MSQSENKNEPILIKVYLIILFFCGIGLWLAAQPSSKHILSVDVDINNQVNDTLSTKGVLQENILKQYARERSSRGASWNEFYKTVRLLHNHSSIFESDFRKIARSLKVGLSRTDNDDGSVTYKFYSPDRNYSNITFLNPKKFQKNKAAKK